ncbi:MAG: ribbon-helix-helix protein, CopG family [Gemmatimonadaceae bacterium]
MRHNACENPGTLTFTLPASDDARLGEICDQLGLSKSEVMRPECR